MRWTTRLFGLARKVPGLPSLVRLVAAQKRLIASSSFVRHVLAVSSSAVVAQAIGLVVGPINSRQYDPSDYGLVAVFGSLFTILTVVSTMRYEMAIPIAEDDVEGANAVLVCLVSSLVWATIAALAVLLFGRRIAMLLSSDQRLPHYMWFLPLGMVGASVFATLWNWGVRKRAFRDLSVARILQSTMGSTCTVTLGALHAGPMGLVIGSLVASTCGVSRLAQRVLRDVRDMRAGAKGITVQGAIRAAKRYHRFPLYNTWSTLLYAVSLQAPVLMLSKAFGPVCTGHYSMCQRLLILPSALISGAIVPVFYSRAKQAETDGALGALASRLVETLAGLNAGFMLLIVFFGEPLFSFVFGKQWGTAGTYASLLAPSLFVNFVVQPMSPVPLVSNRMGAELAWKVAQLCVCAGSLSIGAYVHSDLLALALLGGANLVYQLAYLSWLLRLVGVPSKRVFATMAMEVMVAGAPIGACRLLLWLNARSLPVALAALAAVMLFLLRRALLRITRDQPSVAIEAAAIPQGSEPRV